MATGAAPPAFIAEALQPKKTEGDLAPTILKGLRDAGQRLVDLDSQIETVEAQLKSLKTDRQELVSKTIPDMFDQAGTDHVGLPEAAKDLVLENYYKANIGADWDPDAKKLAFDWLDNNGAGSLIGTKVELVFSKEDFQAAKEFVEHCQFMQKEFEEGRSNMGPIPFPIMDMSVRWNTLTAYVKEQHEKGVSLPLETLGATVGRVAKLKKRKK